MKDVGFLPRTLVMVALFLPVLLRPAGAVTPGVDIAAPRVTMSLVGSALAFVPAFPAVEQGDYVQWKNNGTGIHTSTSGPACAVVDGQWDFALGPGVTTPAQQFTQAPATSIAYHCTPHCGLGMTGAVMVTGSIDLQATNSGSVLTLTWTGGSGHYQVFRGDTAQFATSQTFLPDGNVDTGTTFTDPALQPSPGKALFYMVMNRSLS